MKDNFIYDIENLTFKNLGNDKFFLINGWCASLNGEAYSFFVKVDEQTYEFEPSRIERIDIKNKKGNQLTSARVGFRYRISVKNVPDSFEFYIRTDKKDILIKSAGKSKIKRMTNNSLIDYSIDSFKLDNNKNEFTLVGWGYSFNKEKIDFSIIDDNGNSVEINFNDASRLDLWMLKMVDDDQKRCGFRINFKNTGSSYTLKMVCGNYQVQKKLSQMDKSMYILMRSYARSFNVDRVKNAVNYLKKNGVKQFIERVKAGPNDLWLKYNEWFEHTKVSKQEIERQKNVVFEYSPKISIIVATYNTAENYLKEMIDSVVNQTYSNWQLCIGDGSTNDSVENYVREHYLNDSRIVFKRLEKNYGISGNMNGALDLVTGDYVGLFDHDDLLTPDALFEIVSSMQEIRHDVVYTDEDKLNDKNKRFEDPHFKPDFSIDQLRSHNYITHFFVVSMDIVNEIGGLRSEYDGSQDHDFIFRCVEKANSIHHIPKILYHWRMHPLSTAQDPESKMYCYVSGKKAIEAHYERMGIDAKVEMLPQPLYGMYHTTYAIKGEPLVSILIPNMNQKNTLEKCINSLYNVNTYKNFEIVIIENNSTEQEIFDYYKELENTHDNVRIVTWQGVFNYSEINNFGVKHTKGDYILFLNNDTEVISPDAITEMLGCAQREEVGVVGAKLFYEDDTVQHCGVVVGYKGYATAAFSLLEKDAFGYMGRPRVTTNFSAVTAACMMVKRKDFDEVSGFDPRFRVACNDVDLCLKIRGLDKLVVQNVFSHWYHYESKTRGLEDTPEKLERFNNEVALFQEKWPEILKNGDPFHNVNFILDEGPFTIPHI